MDLGALEITWCGHSTFVFKMPSGKRAIVDPWLEQNPACPPRLKRQEAVDAIFITHAHSDHMGDVVALAKRHKSTCVGIVETCAWLGKQGVTETIGMNKGGTVEAAGIRATMTHATHSCGIGDGDAVVYGGEAAGYVLTFENGIRIYHAGDTAATMDMKIIGDIYKPDIAMLPIGGHYTMDPQQAAYAIRLIGAKFVIPMHFGTFPILTGTPDELRRHTADIADLCIIEMAPGQTLTGQLKIT